MRGLNARAAQARSRAHSALPRWPRLPGHDVLIALEAVDSDRRAGGADRGQEVDHELEIHASMIARSALKRHRSRRREATHRRHVPSRGPDSRRNRQACGTTTIGWMFTWICPSERDLVHWVVVSVSSAEVRAFERNNSPAPIRCCASAVPHRMRNMRNPSPSMLPSSGSASVDPRSTWRRGVSGLCVVTTTCMDRLASRSTSRIEPSAPGCIDASGSSMTISDGAGRCNRAECSRMHRRFRFLDDHQRRRRSLQRGQDEAQHTECPVGHAEGFELDGFGPRALLSKLQRQLVAMLLRPHVDRPGPRRFSTTRRSVSDPRPFAGSYGAHWRHSCPSERNPEPPSGSCIDRSASESIRYVRMPARKRETARKRRSPPINGSASALGSTSGAGASTSLGQLVDPLSVWRRNQSLAPSLRTTTQFSSATSKSLFLRGRRTR